jgi:hypothetical protein
VGVRDKRTEKREKRKKRSAKEKAGEEDKRSRGEN